MDVVATLATSQSSRYGWNFSHLKIRNNSVANLDAAIEFSCTGGRAGRELQCYGRGGEQGHLRSWLMKRARLCSPTSRNDSPSKIKRLFSVHNRISRINSCFFFSTSFCTQSQNKTQKKRMKYKWDRVREHMRDHTHENNHYRRNSVIDTSFSSWSVFNIGRYVLSTILMDL